MSGRWVVECLGCDSGVPGQPHTTMLRLIAAAALDGWAVEMPPRYVLCPTCFEAVLPDWPTTWLGEPNRWWRLGPPPRCH